MSDFDLGDLRIRSSLPAGAYNNHGFYQFVEHMEHADRLSVEEAAEEGARVAQLTAPSATGALKRSIRASTATTDTAGVGRGAIYSEIIVGTNHWRYAETGAVPHDITGRVTFWWEKEGRFWDPGSNTIKHPGMQGTHFMRAGYHAAAEELPRAMRRNYAGW